MPFRHYQPPLPLPLQPNARSSHPPGPYLYEFNNPPPVTAWYPDSVPMVSDDFVTRLPGFTEEMPSEHRQDYYRYPSRQQGYPPAETYRQPRKTIQRDPNLKRPPAVARVATKPHQHEHPDGGGFGNFPSANTSAARHSAHSGLPLPEVADDVALGNALSRVFGAIPLQVAFIGLGPIAKANRSLKQFKASLKLLFFGNSKLPQYMYIAVLNMKDSLSSQEYIRKQQSRYRLHHPITAQQIIIDQEVSTYITIKFMSLRVSDEAAPAFFS